MQSPTWNQYHTEERAGCVNAAVSVLGNKWTPLIVMEIARGSSRFSSLQNAVPDICPRTLSQRLRDLETHRLVTKHYFTERPPRTEYRLTQKGRDLLPIITEMADWGSKYPD